MMQLDGPSCPGCAHCVPFTCLKRACIATRTSLPWDFWHFLPFLSFGSEGLFELSGGAVLDDSGMDVWSSEASGIWQLYVAFPDSRPMGQTLHSSINYQPYHASVFPCTDVFWSLKSSFEIENLWTCWWSQRKYLIFLTSENTQYSLRFLNHTFALQGFAQDTIATIDTVQSLQLARRRHLEGGHQFR